MSYPRYKKRYRDYDREERLLKEKKELEEKNEIKRLLNGIKTYGFKSSKSEAEGGITIKSMTIKSGNEYISLLIKKKEGNIFAYIPTFMGYEVWRIPLEMYNAFK